MYAAFDLNKIADRIYKNCLIRYFELLKFTLIFYLNYLYTSILQCQNKAGVKRFLNTIY